MRPGPDLPVELRVRLTARDRLAGMPQPVRARPEHPSGWKNEISRATSLCSSSPSRRCRRRHRHRRSADGAVAAMQFLGQRAEVRLVGTVLQVAGNLGLLGFRSAAPHRVDPLAHSAGVTPTLIPERRSIGRRESRAARASGLFTGFSWAQRYLPAGCSRTSAADLDRYFAQGEGRGPGRSPAGVLAPQRRPSRRRPPRALRTPVTSPQTQASMPWPASTLIARSASSGSVSATIPTPS